MKILGFDDTGLLVSQDIASTGDGANNPKIVYYDPVSKNYLYTAYGPLLTSDGKNYINNSVGAEAGNLYIYDNQGNAVNTMTISVPGGSDPLYILAVVVLPQECINQGYYLAVLGQDLSSGNDTLYLYIYDDDFNKVREVNLGDMSDDYIPTLYAVYFSTSLGNFYLIGTGPNNKIFYYNPISDNLQFGIQNYDGYILGKPLLAYGNLYLYCVYGSYNYSFYAPSSDPLRFSSKRYTNPSNFLTFDKLVYQFISDNYLYVITNDYVVGSGLRIGRLDITVVSNGSNPPWTTIYLDVPFTVGWASVFNDYLFVGSNDINTPGVWSYNLSDLLNATDGSIVNSVDTICADCYNSVGRILYATSPGGYDTLRFS